MPSITKSPTRSPTKSSPTVSRSGSSQPKHRKHKLKKKPPILESHILQHHMYYIAPIAVVCLLIALLVLIIMNLSENSMQIHISIGANEREMIVTWTLRTKLDGKAQVWYCEQGGSTLIASAEETHFEDGDAAFYTYRALLTKLKPDTEYEYRVGDDSLYSEYHSFRTLKSGNDWKPRFVIYGDLGLDSPHSLPYLKKDVEAGMYDMAFHIGDIAYDLNVKNGEVGHDFMSSIESIASRIPYMTCPGNHEKHLNFSHYDARFSMLGDRHQPATSSSLNERLNNHFHSMDIGPVHIVMFSTEFYFHSKIYNHRNVRTQYQWLEADLQRAVNNRKNVPWIFVMGHQPLYCFKKKDRACNLNKFERRRLRRGKVMLNENNERERTWGLEELFYRHRVDIEFYGHEHYYVRTLPIYDSKVKGNNGNATLFVDASAPIHVVTGSAGNFENHYDFNPLMKQLDWIGYHHYDFGYTRLKFLDKYSLRIEQISVDADGKVTDVFEMRKTQ